jgi:hypothetical protein
MSEGDDLVRSTSVLPLPVLVLLLEVEVLLVVDGSGGPCVDAELAQRDPKSDLKMDELLLLLFMLLGSRCGAMWSLCDSTRLACCCWPYISIPAGGGAGGGGLVRTHLAGPNKRVCC